jgi:hypothetical protein
MVAMVGARNASSLGTRMARSLAGGLGEAGFAWSPGWPAASMPRRISPRSKAARLPCTPAGSK